MATDAFDTSECEAVPALQAAAFALRMVKGPMPGRCWEIGEQALVIGRGFGCAVRIQDPFMSRTQCEIVLREGAPHLRDLDSRNATQVNGAICREAALKHGDVISFPAATLLIEIATPESQRGTAETATSHTTIAFGEALHLRGPFDEPSYAATPHAVEQLHALFAMLRELSQCETVDLLVAGLRRHLAQQLRPDESWVGWGTGPDGGLVLHPPASRIAHAPLSILNEVQRSGEGVLSDTQDKGSAFVTLAAPLRHGGAPFGALGVRRSLARGGYGKNDLQYLLAAAESAAPLIRAAERLEQLRRDAQVLDTSVPAAQRLMGESTAIKRLRAELAKAARARGNVLLGGETGAGKELAARAIHDLSDRAEQPYVVVNCPAIAPDLFEAEMFGHEAGSFTGAQRKRHGLMQQAHGGTLFLDEVGDLSPQHQARILRAVETGAFRPVGANAEVAVDVRVIAASNRPLTGAGSVLRFDLYQRLSAICIELPPLRDRAEDILLLAEAFRTHSAPSSLARPSGFTNEAKGALLRYPWPGNVRELRNVIERACHTATWNEIVLADLHLDLPCDVPCGAPNASGTLDEIEKDHIARVLAQHHGNVHEAAKSLGIARSTLYYRIARFGLRAPRQDS